MNTIMGSLGDGLSKAIVSALGDISVSHAFPYDHYASLKYRVNPLTDYWLLDMIVESLWRRTEKGPSQLRIDMLDILLRLYPDNQDLYLR